jgi:adenosine kinase
MDTVIKEVQQNENVTYIIGIGNPILDISANVEEESLRKYNLEYGRTVFKNDENVGIYDYLESQKDVTYVAGGSITNTIRIANVKFI